MTSVHEYHESRLIYGRQMWHPLVKAEGAMCPDGVRRTAYPSSDGVADTFYSIPARVRVTHNHARYTISGYVTTATMSGMSTPTDEDPLTVYFHPYLYGRNGWIIASTDALRQYVRKADEYARERVRFLTDENPRIRELYTDEAEVRYPYSHEARVEITRRDEAGTTDE